jgi:hypothetical protein
MTKIKIKRMNSEILTKNRDRFRRTETIKGIKTK